MSLNRFRAQRNWETAAEEAAALPVMLKLPRTFVDFHGEFAVPNAVDGQLPVPESIEAIPGKELAAYLAGELRAQGFEVGAPEPADFEYVIAWQGARRKFELHVCVDDFCAMERWTIQAACQQRSLFRRTLKSNDVDDLVRLLETLDQVLKESPRIRDVRWFPCFETPGELNRQVGYAGPLSDERVWQPEVTRVYRLITLHTRWCDAGWPWCIPTAIAGVLVYVLVAAAGFPKFAPWAISLTVLGAIGPFVGLGTGALLLGIDLFQQRQRAGQTGSAVVGMVLLSLAGTFLLWISGAAVWAFLQALPHWK